MMTKADNHDGQLAGRVALVTGSGGGLGRAHALYLASKGAKLIVNDLSSDRAEAVAAEIADDGGEAMSFAASVTDQVAIEGLVQQALDRWGRVDILVNNAGILRDKSFAKMTMDDFRLVVDVHLIGTAICCKAVWDVMREQGYGRIVMTTSSSGLWGNFGQANYAAAKMGVVGLMQTLAIEGEKYGIRVNSLAPTASTQMTHDVLSENSLAKLAPSLVSPALLTLVGEEAPTRAILCAGAGHFATASISLSEGRYIGGGTDAGELVAANWQELSDRTGDMVPAYGFFQAEREIAHADSAHRSGEGAQIMTALIP